jgi:hypothetical protein
MIEEGASLDEITATWPSQLNSFAAVRGRYLLYP